ncbi:amidase [Microvirga makkahensis]|uniref:Amidase n=1 Tax=Microvirga makkahensis TaxID=1128670 RepID=A0A7X3MWD4_9HYPH|nr:amidase [Microvirga makkahensis]MXQ14459.1 amidase [Microvirga makkahensis]
MATAPAYQPENLPSDERSIPTVASAGAMLLARDVSATDLLEGVLERIDRMDKEIATYVHVDAEGARTAAREADQEIAAGRWRGPLHGIPFGVKDNYDTAGLPSQAGSRLRLGRIAADDAFLIAKLKAAGAVLVGKLATWEYGTGNGGEYFDTPFRPTRNPWDPQRFPGASSTGAGAAVAAGTALFALGSDTTGSVRLPAAACGVLSIKPSHGLLGRSGILPNCYSLDAPGALTWTAEDQALVLDAIVGQDPGDPASVAPRTRDHGRDLNLGIAGLRIAVVRDMGPDMPVPDGAMSRAFDAGIEVLKSLGAHVVETRLPFSVMECFSATRMIGPAESAAIHEEEMRTRAGEMGFALRDKLLSGSMVRAVDYVAAQRFRRAVAEQVETFLRPFDALVTFGTLKPAPLLGSGQEMFDYIGNTALTPFNLSGHPALIQCTGFSDASLPLSWQLVGHRYAEAMLLRVAAAYERATPWRERRPALLETARKSS